MTAPDKTDRNFDEVFERLRVVETEQARHGERLTTLKEDVGRKVGIADFTPVKLIAYGAAGIVLAGFVGLLIRVVGWRALP